MGPKYDSYMNTLADSDEEPTLDPTPFIDAGNDSDDDSIDVIPNAFQERQPTPPYSDPDDVTEHDELLCTEEMPEAIDDITIWKRQHVHFGLIKQKYYNLQRVTGEYSNEYHFKQVAQSFFDLIHNTSTHLVYTKMTFVQKDNSHVPTIWYVENKAGFATTCFECLEKMGIVMYEDFAGNMIEIDIHFNVVTCIDMPVRPMTLDEALFTDCPEKALVTNVGTLFKEGTYFPALRACKRQLAHHVAYAYYGNGAPSSDTKCSCGICKHFDENSAENVPLYKPMVLDGECAMQEVAHMIIDEEAREGQTRCRDDCQFTPYSL